MGLSKINCEPRNLEPRLSVKFLRGETPVLIVVDLHHRLLSPHFLPHRGGFIGPFAVKSHVRFVQNDCLYNQEMF